MLALRATVNTGTAGQTISNNVTVTALDQADPTTGNNSATRNVTVQSADLALTKTVNIATAIPIPTPRMRMAVAVNERARRKPRSAIRIS